MKCPKCTDAEMHPEVCEQITIDRCPSCHGIWLDAMELEKLLAAHPRALLAEDRRFAKAAGETGSRINCPLCKGTYLIKLNSRSRPGVVLDSCTVCYGTWLDAGELSALAGGQIGGWLRSLFGMEG